MAAVAPIAMPLIKSVGMSLLTGVLMKKLTGEKNAKTPVATPAVPAKAVADQAAATAAQHEAEAARKSAIFRKAQTGGQQLLVSPRRNAYLGLPGAGPQKTKLGGSQ